MCNATVDPTVPSTQHAIEMVFRQQIRRQVSDARFLAGTGATQGIGKDSQTVVESSVRNKAGYNALGEGPLKQ